MLNIPSVIHKTAHGEKVSDIYSCLLDQRIIMLDGEVNDQQASIINACLMYLDAQNNDDIKLYINSPGGSVVAGMSIIDTMNLIKSDVVTIVTGMAASMGAMILTCGAQGKRYATPNAEVMIHQPLGGAQGQATDIIITARHIERTRTRLYQILADTTGKSFDEIKHDAERDYYMESTEALAYGIIDKVLD